MWRSSRKRQSLKTYHSGAVCGAFFQEYSFRSFLCRDFYHFLLTLVFPFISSHSFIVFTSLVGYYSNIFILGYISRIYSLWNLLSSVCCEFRSLVIFHIFHSLLTHTFYSFFFISFISLSLIWTYHSFL